MTALDKAHTNFRSEPGNGGDSGPGYLPIPGGYDSQKLMGVHPAAQRSIQRGRKGGSFTIVHSLHLRFGAYSSSSRLFFVEIVSVVYHNINGQR